MSEIRNALSRKFGPLPAWAWAAIGLAAVFAYRSLRGEYAPGATTGGTGTDGSADFTPPERQEPVTLQPGESVYDPNTGQLVGTAPEQQTPEPTTPDAPPLNPTAPKPPKVKRKPKPKPHHHKKHQGETHKTRGKGSLKDRITRKRKKKPAAKKVHARQVYHPAKKPAGKSRLRAIPVRKPAVRQRPAATHPKAHAASHGHPKATPHKTRKKRR